MAEEFETLVPSYLVHTTPIITTTKEILIAIVIVNSDDYNKILKFTSRIKTLYNTVNMTIRTTYGKFIPDWTTHAQFNNLNYSGKKECYYIFN